MRYRTRNRYERKQPRPQSGPTLRATPPGFSVGREAALAADPDLVAVHVTDPSQIHGGGHPGMAHVADPSLIHGGGTPGEAHVADPRRIHNGGFPGEAHVTDPSQIHYAPPPGVAHVPGHHHAALHPAIAQMLGLPHGLTQHQAAAILLANRYPA